MSLLAALTLEEKISLAHGGADPDPALVGQVGYLPGVPRLGIPVRRDANALGIEGGTSKYGLSCSEGMQSGRWQNSRPVPPSELSSVSYVVRTKWNVRKGDGTVVFSLDPILSGMKRDRE